MGLLMAPKGAEFDAAYERAERAAQLVAAHVVKAPAHQRQVEMALLSGRCSTIAAGTGLALFTVERIASKCIEREEELKRAREAAERAAEREAA
jgi:succinyl-CoA synthetase beta subunit